MAPSVTARACSMGLKAPAGWIASRRQPLLLSARTAAPAARRNFAASNSGSLPPPTSNSRRAINPAGRCTNADSKNLPVNSFAAYISAISPPVSSLKRPPGDPSLGSVSKRMIASASASTSSGRTEVSLGVMANPYCSRLGQRALGSGSPCVSWRLRLETWASGPLGRPPVGLLPHRRPLTRGHRRGRGRPRHQLKLRQLPTLSRWRKGSASSPNRECTLQRNSHPFAGPRRGCTSAAQAAPAASNRPQPGCCTIALGNRPTGKGQR